MFSLSHLNMDTRPPSIQGDPKGFQRGVGKEQREDNKFVPKQQDSGCEGRSQHHPQMPDELHLLPLWHADLQPGVEIAWNDSKLPCCQSHRHRHSWLQSAGLSLRYSMHCVHCTGFAIGRGNSQLRSQPCGRIHVGDEEEAWKICFPVFHSFRSQLIIDQIKLKLK